MGRSLTNGAECDQPVLHRTPRSKRDTLNAAVAHPVTCGTPAASRADRFGRCGVLLLSIASLNRSCMAAALQKSALCQLLKCGWGHKSVSEN